MKRLKSRIVIIIVFIIVLIICVIAALLGKRDNQNIEGISYEQDISQTEIASDSTMDCYENRIAITFDDGPGNTTEELLDGLKERGVKATFFLIGESAKEYPDIVKRMSEEGHLIGSHTYSHVQLSAISSDEAYNEIVKANQMIEDITGTRPVYIRPPYGSYSEKLLAQINMIPVLWTVDPEDWNTKNTAAVVSKVVKNVKCGDIILLHDIYKSSVAAALEIIDQLQAKGYVFVTVDQILLD